MTEPALNRIAADRIAEQDAEIAELYAQIAGLESDLDDALVRAIEAEREREAAVGMLRLSVVDSGYED